MRKQRTFRPTGDRLESRDVPASFGLPSRIAAVPQAVLASRLNTPFANTLRLGIGTFGRQVSFNRTANTGAGAFNNLNNVGLNRLGNSLGFNLGPNQTNNLTVNQLASVLNQLSAGSPLGNSNILANVLRANVNNPNLSSVLGNNTALINRLRTNINNPNLPLLLRGGPTSILASGLNFPATLSSAGTGVGTGSGLNSLLGGTFGNGTGLGSLLGGSTFGPFGNTNSLTAGTQGFVSFQ